MAARITILCENSVSRPGELIGEHGFAALIETPDTAILFDTGQGFGLLQNAQEIGRDLQQISAVVLSHGHSDHTGGLPLLLDHLQRPLSVLAHPDLFAERYWRCDFEQRAIGIPFSRSELEARGAVFTLTGNFTELATDLYCSGEVPRRTAYEKGDSHLVVPDGSGGFRQDPIHDDLSLALCTEKGLVILLGCAHAGVVNIIEHFRVVTGEERVCAVLGGTHLGPVSDEQFQETVAALKRYNISRIGLSHCTGLNRAAQLYQEIPGRCFFASAGTVLEYP